MEPLDRMDVRLMRYDTLNQLHTAFQSGELDGCAVAIDNDTTGMYVDDVKVFEMHNADLLEQALDLLTIPHESV